MLTGIHMRMMASLKAHYWAQASKQRTKRSLLASPAACFGHTSTAPAPCSCCLISRAYCSRFTGSCSVPDAVCALTGDSMRKQGLWGPGKLQEFCRRIDLKMLEYSLIGGSHENCLRSPVSLSVEGCMLNTTCLEGRCARFRCRGKCLVA